MLDGCGHNGYLAVSIRIWCSSRTILWLSGSRATAVLRRKVTQMAPLAPAAVAAWIAAVAFDLARLAAATSIISRCHQPLEEMNRSPIAGIGYTYAHIVLLARPCLHGAILGFPPSFSSS